MKTRLLAFDSGIGGLSVVREIVRVMPAVETVYVADDAGFPYGDWEDEPLTERIVGLMGALMDRFAPDLVVIPCHTASTLVLPALRARFEIPFVGTVPAIKPAAERSRSRLISVLGTMGTIKRDYTRALIDSFAKDCHVRLVGSANLATLAEAYMRGEAVDDEAVWTEIGPAFMEADSGRTDMIVLACTHYPFLVDRFVRLAPWPVEWIDPAPAIARRVVSVIGEQVKGPPARGSAYLTSGKHWPVSLVHVLRHLGLEPENEAATLKPAV
jgi:glutamate racemase